MSQHYITMDHLDDEDLEILTLDKMYLPNSEETWLLDGFVRNEDGQLSHPTGAMRLKSQTYSNKSTGAESRRQARFKTQVIKYDELLGDDEDIDLEAPPSLSSLDDFGPEKLPFAANALDTTAIRTGHQSVPVNTTVTQESSYNGDALTPNSAAFKTSVLDRINAVRMKYATPKPAITPDSDFEDPLSPVLDNVRPVDAPQAKANIVIESPIIKSLEDVQYNSSSVHRTFEDVSNRNLRELPNLILEQVPKSDLNGTFEKSNNSSVLNRTFEEPPLTAPPRKLTLVSRKQEDSECKPHLLNRTFEDLCSNNKLSLMNNNLFVATSPIASKETSQSLSNIPESVSPKPTLKKQGTFEILDDIDDSESHGTEENNLFQTMVLDPRESAGSNGYGNEFVSHLSIASTPSDKAKSRTLTLLNQERAMNASFTISRHDDSYNEALDVESHMNRSFTVSREQTMEDHMNNLKNSLNSSLNSPLNSSFNKLNGVDTDYFNTLHNNDICNDANTDFLNLSSHKEELPNHNLSGHREELPSHNLSGHREELPSHNLNESFIVSKHEECDEHNSSDINDNIVNGKVIRPSEVNTNSYRTFTRPKKSSSAGGAYRNGTAGGVQRKFLLGNMKPSLAPNMNSTYNTDDANLNETVTLNSTAMNRRQTNRFATVTRESRSTVVTEATNMNETVTLNPTSNKQSYGNGSSSGHLSNASRFSTITRPKSKLTYGAPTSLLSQGKVPQYAPKKLKNSSSTESLKSNESYVISRPNGVRPSVASMQNRKSLYKSMGALNINNSKPVEYSKVQSTENLSVKSSGGSDSDSVNGSVQGGPFNGNRGVSSGRPQSGLLRPGFSRIPAPGSRIPPSKPSMLQRYSAARR